MAHPSHAIRCKPTVKPIPAPVGVRKNTEDKRFASEGKREVLATDLELAGGDKRDDLCTSTLDIDSATIGFPRADQTVCKLKRSYATRRKNFKLSQNRWRNADEVVTTMAPGSWQFEAAVEMTRSVPEREQTSYKHAYTERHQDNTVKCLKEKLKVSTLQVDEKEACSMGILDTPSDDEEHDSLRPPRRKPKKPNLTDSFSSLSLLDHEEMQKTTDPALLPGSTQTAMVFPNPNQEAQIAGERLSDRLPKQVTEGNCHVPESRPLLVDVLRLHPNSKNKSDCGGDGDYSSIGPSMPHKCLKVAHRTPPQL